MPAGRPSKFKPEFVEHARKLCEMGATDSDLAEFFAVSIKTIDNWRGKHPEFLQALKIGKGVADDRVERSLYHRAVGYQREATKVFLRANDEEPVYAPYLEDVQPDTAAAIFWLKNRRPADWRDRHEVTGADGGPVAHRDETDRSAADEAARKLALALTHAVANKGVDRP